MKETANGQKQYKVYEPTAPHFITCTVLHWIPIFTRTQTTEIVFESLRYLQQNDNLKLHAYVILENYLHLVSSSDDISRSISRFKRHTAREIIDLLKKANVKTVLDHLAFYKKAHKRDREYQFWQEGMQPKQILSDSMMIERINYIHNNPVKRGYVDEGKAWRYSSARNYEGMEGLIEIERFW